ncbi:MAG: biotin/lipoyl-binding protein [Methylotenera sp.]|nr:biotin/lipoyl-binding protein [Oligoflexia bacterium]
MSDSFKVSGRKVALPTAEKGWTFTPRPGGWVLGEREVNGTVERQRFFLHEAKGQLSASLGGFLYQGQILQSGRGGAAAAGSDADLIAQFPGKVRKILVQVGAQVQENEPLLLIEAMKMEFAVKAPFAGVVTAIHVTEAQQLAPGQRFLDITPTEADAEVARGK